MGLRPQAQRTTVVVTRRLETSITACTGAAAQRDDRRYLTVMHREAWFELIRKSHRPPDARTAPQPNARRSPRHSDR